MEREFYYSKRADAVKRPSLKISGIEDGMDQNKLDVPHYCNWSNPKVCISM